MTEYKKKISDLEKRSRLRKLLKHHKEESQKIELYKNWVNVPEPKRNQLLSIVEKNIEMIEQDIEKLIFNEVKK